MWEESKSKYEWEKKEVKRDKDDTNFIFPGISKALLD